VTASTESSKKTNVFVTTEMDQVDIEKRLEEVLDEEDIEIIKADDNLTADINTKQLNLREDYFKAIDSIDESNWAIPLVNYAEGFGSYMKKAQHLDGSAPTCKGTKRKPKKNRDKIKKKNKSAKKAKRKNRK